MTARRLTVPVLVFLLVTFPGIPSAVADLGQPSCTDSVVCDDFNRTTFGGCWAPEGAGTSQLDGAQLVMTRNGGQTNLIQTCDSYLDEGVLQFRWRPGSIPSNWKEFYVGLRYSSDTPSSAWHRTILSPERSQVCIEGNGGGCWPFAFQLQWYTIEVRHYSGTQSVRIDGTLIGSRSYPPTEVAWGLILSAVDDGQSHFVDWITYHPPTPTLPSAPQSLSASGGVATVALSWSAPANEGYPPITGYRIYRGTNPGSLSWVRDVGTQTSTTDTGLSAGTTYYYRVAALNGAGEGPLSNSASATTVAPPSAPSAPTATAEPGIVTLTWSPPASNGGSSLTGYRVYRGDSGSSLTLLKSVDTSLTTTDATVAAATTYWYAVSAVSAAGEGPQGTASSVSTPTVPSAPQDVAAQNQRLKIHLMWSAPATDGGDAIDSYEIWRGSDASSLTYLAPASSSARGWDDTNITVNSERYYQVRARNGVGAGAPSPVVQGHAIDVPSEPRDVAASAFNGTVEVRWSPPLTDNGSPISAYEVYRQASGGSYTLVRTTSGSESRVFDAPLANGTSYSYQLKARNEAGSGSASTTASSTPDPKWNTSGWIFPSSGTAGTNRWYKSAVDLSFTARGRNDPTYQPLVEYTLVRKQVDAFTGRYLDELESASGWVARGQTSSGTAPSVASSTTTVRQGYGSLALSITNSLPVANDFGPNVSKSLPSPVSLTGADRVTLFVKYAATTGNAGKLTVQLYENSGGTGLIATASQATLKVGTWNQVVIALPAGTTKQVRNINLILHEEIKLNTNTNTQSYWVDAIGTSSSSLKETSEGIFRWRVRAKESATQSETTQEHLVKLDWTGPRTTLAASGLRGDNGWFKDDATVWVNATDSLVGVSGVSGACRSRYDYPSPNQWGAPNGTEVVTAAGTSIVDSQTEDCAGNMGASTSLMVKIDRTKPATAISFSGAGHQPWYSTDVTVTLSASDADSGVSRIYYSFDNVTWQSGAASQVSFVRSGVGTHRITYYAKDVAGHEENKRSYALYIETTPPVFELPSPSPGSTQSVVTKVRIQYYDPASAPGPSGMYLPDSSLQLQVWNPVFSRWDSPSGSSSFTAQATYMQRTYAAPLAPGHYRATANARDTAGNAATSQWEFDVGV